MRWRNVRPDPPAQRVQQPTTPALDEDSASVAACRQRWADLVATWHAGGEPRADLRDAMREPTRFLPLVGSVLMTRGARWRASGGRP